MILILIISNKLIYLIIIIKNYLHYDFEKKIKLQHETV